MSLFHYFAGMSSMWQKIILGSRSNECMHFKYDQFMEGSFIHSLLIVSIIYRVSFQSNDGF